MSTILDIDKKLVVTITGLNAFKTVDTIGRKAMPAVLNYPAAFVYFAGDHLVKQGNKLRNIYDTAYDIIVTNKNLRSEQDAAYDTYNLLDLVRDAIQGKKLDLTNVMPFECVSRELFGYEDGVISYVVRFTTCVFYS